jgi:hypothetical protein
MTGKTPLSAKVSFGLSIVLLALSLTFGVSSVRADTEAAAPSWSEMLIDPILKALHAVEARLSSLEATVASFAGSVTSQQIVARELCVSDHTGAQTCITKAQLDAVLGTMARTAAIAPSATATEGPAIVIEPTVTITITEAMPSTEEKESVAVESAEVETAPAMAAPEPATTVAQAPMAEDRGGEEPAHTHSVSPIRSGDALVSHPEVESSIPATPSDDE